MIITDLMKNDTPSILNVCGGRLLPLDLDLFDDYWLLNVDTMYTDLITDIQINEFGFGDNKLLYHREDIYEFLSRIYINFDVISVYRFLEHVSYVDVPYFIYLLSTATRKGSVVDIIVPDYEKMAHMILDEVKQKSPPGIVNGYEFEYHNILLTTEMLNEVNDPHTSIWTSRRLKYFFELEGRFKVRDIEYSYEFDNRNIYIRSLIERI